MLSEQEIDGVVQQIVRRIRPDKVIVFGSYAKQCPGRHSDLDIFVIQQSTLPMSSRINPLRSLMANRLIPIDIHVYTPEEVDEYGKVAGSFVHSVMTTGKIVYARR
jgi:predicted nucleotidyltransferase